MTRVPGRKASHRDVGPFLQWFRERMLGREMETNKRFADEISARTQAPPNLPPGPSHQLSANYYHLRDARRRVTPPLYIAGPEEQKKIAAGEKQPDSSIIPGTIGATPGRLYDPGVEPVAPVRDPAKLEKLKKEKK